MKRFMFLLPLMHFNAGSGGEGGGGGSTADLERKAREMLAENQNDILTKAEKKSKEICDGLIKQAEEALKAGEAKDRKEAMEALEQKMQKTVDDFAAEIRNEMKNGGQEKKGQFVEFAEKNASEYKEADKGYARSIEFKAAALMTTANVIPNVAGGFSPLFGNYIDQQIGHTPKPDNVIMPLINVISAPGTENIYYTDRINEEGDAEFIGEGDLKPLADAEWKTTQKSTKEVAVRWKQTKRLMNHAPSVIQDFYQHATELVNQKIDDQLLVGDGTGDNLEGLEAIASAFVVPTELAEYYEDANIYDVINAMAVSIRLNNFKGQITAVLNTVWKAKMMGIKDKEGRYNMPDFVSPDGTMVSDVKIVFSNKIAADHILIGDLKRFNLVMAENVTYDEGYENDDFSKNLISKKLEAFMGTYIKTSDGGAILYDSIADVLTDIAVPVV